LNYLFAITIVFYFALAAVRPKMEHADFRCNSIVSLLPQQYKFYCIHWTFFID